LAIKAYFNNQMIKATDKDKEQISQLLNALKDLPIFEEQIKAANELFKKAVIIVK